MIHRCFILILACSLFNGCAYFRSKTDQPDTTGFSIEQVKKDMVPLQLSLADTPTEAIQDYFRFYDLNHMNVQHWFGAVESEGETLATHVFIPLEPRGTVFLIHGYFDHTGTLSKLIAESLRQGYAVVAWDLPGHGLSTGKRTATGQFNLCADQFFDIVERSAAHLPQPFHLISHSTGSSIAIEYLHNPDPNIFANIVFMAPLIRHTYWGWGKFGYAISNPFVDKLRRRDKKNSHDKDYLAFVKKDPLHSAILSYDYLGDFYRWEKKVQDYPLWPASICVVQGDKDSVVKWKYNIPFLEAHVEGLKIHMITGAKHQLANEADTYRQQAFERVFHCLNVP